MPDKKEISCMDWFTCKKLKTYMMYKGCCGRYWLANFSTGHAGIELQGTCKGCKKGKELYDALNQQARIK